MTDNKANTKMGKAPREYRDTPKHFIEPTAEELKARNKRNFAIAIALAAFMAFVFITMITRGS